MANIPTKALNLQEKLGNMHVTKLINEGRLSLEPNVMFGSFNVTNGRYTGQILKTAAEGIGRLVGRFGIYEGQFKNGVADGWGGFIDKNANHYEGMLKNGLYHGDG